MKALLFLAILTCTAHADDAVGRFRLVPATVEFVPKAKGALTTENRSLFNIDTVTGQAWRYFSGMTKGKLVEGWTEIEN